MDIRPSQSLWATLDGQLDEDSPTRSSLGSRNRFQQSIKTGGIYKHFKSSSVVGSHVRNKLVHGVNAKYVKSRKNSKVSTEMLVAGQSHST